MRYVRQEDHCGCVVASLAMVTGRTYREVKAYFVGCDFENDGITHHDAETYLGEMGFATIRHYRRLPFWIHGDKLFEWEMVKKDGRIQAYRQVWPSRPFAPAHLIGIGGGRHCAVMTHDGTVLDPNQDGHRSLADCGEVSYVIGVFDIRRKP